MEITVSVLVPALGSTGVVKVAVPEFMLRVADWEVNVLAPEMEYNSVYVPFGILEPNTVTVELVPTDAGLVAYNESTIYEPEVPTLIAPVAVMFPHPPVRNTVKLYVPTAVGDPVIETEFAAHAPLTPAGNPVIVAPVAPVVEYVIDAIAVLTHRVWLFVPEPEVNAIELAAVIVKVPDAVTVPHPPDKATV
jgi:hypothetical protein